LITDFHFCDHYLAGMKGRILRDLPNTAIIDVVHQLLGSSVWNRAILVRWPSLEVFTDLRLTPGYIDAQESRVSSSSAYGNLVTIDRADRP
jgi:hypothetical protein